MVMNITELLPDIYFPSQRFENLNFLPRFACACVSIYVYKTVRMLTFKEMYLKPKDGSMIVEKEKYFRNETNISENSSTTRVNNRQYREISTRPEILKIELEAIQKQRGRSRRNRIRDARSLR